jgi:formate hydrogenlyase subunit 3/multisubunit Na+/H+ antiporter MnhD subunit
MTLLLLACPLVGALAFLLIRRRFHMRTRILIACGVALGLALISVAVVSMVGDRPREGSTAVDPKDL